MPASEAIDVLVNTNALQLLQENGLNAVVFQPLVPTPTAESGTVTVQCVCIVNNNNYV